jgi:DNA topoisomerase-1
MAKKDEAKKTPAKKKSANKKSAKSLKKLVIVESPSKANTIKKYLGSGYEVKASVGHIIDLPKSRLGVNLDTFEPDYIVMRDKSKVMKELRDSAKNASEIILASDPDREGEAIAWHIKNDLEKRVLPKIKNRDIAIKRIRFDEITKNAVGKAIDEPKDIDDLLVQAQQGRRVIDRLFGYQLSPLLWKKVKSKLSAGRVQSVALRLICEREDEIDVFVPQEYWNITADFKKDKAKFKANLVKIDGKKIELGDIPNEKTAVRIEKELFDYESIINDIRTKGVKRNPNAPFITSTLQQTANNLLGYSSLRTMKIAQTLYEGVDLGKVRTGLITYMRTDSTRISPVALDELRSYISKTCGKKYLPDTPNVYKNKRSAQDAHEAIRPTSVEYHPDEIKQYLSSEQYKLYNLIWRRFVASQMSPAQTEQYTIEVANGNKALSATSSKTLFDGYQSVYNFGKTAKEKELPHNLNVGDKLELKEVNKEQKFTDPPPRYTDASLVKIMEEMGIGRPSTYAPTIFTLTKRYYVKKEGKSLVPTVLGRVVNNLLVENFPELINVKFTADMEEELDEVEEGAKEWKTVVKDFYNPFSKVLNKAYENIDEIKGVFDEETEYVCEKCGKMMMKKLGRFGFFLACSGWPDCRNAKPLPLGKCPKCEDGLVVAKKGRKGRGFYGCSTYPDCDFVTHFAPSDEKCPNDGSILFNKKEKGQNKLVCLKEGCGYEKDID